MFRSLRPISNFSVPEAEDDFEIPENETDGGHDSDDIFMNLSDEDLLDSRNRSSTVQGVECYHGLHREPDQDNSPVAAAGCQRDNSTARVKDHKIDCTYLIPGCKQDLDFRKFEAHIRKTSSVRDLSENSEAETGFNMAPVIETSVPSSSPTEHKFKYRSMQPDMLVKMNRSRWHTRSLGFLTPSGSRTPTGMQTPTEVQTPTRVSTSVPLKRSVSIADFIHYNTLENVNVSDLYVQQSLDLKSADDNSNIDISQNTPQFIDFSRPSSRHSMRSDRFHVEKKYQSHSCPHSRHHSPPRLRHRIETVNETDGSLPDLVTASTGCNGGIDIKDINFNNLDDIKIINPIDDSLTAPHDVCCSGQTYDCSCSQRQKSEPLNFAALFHRCRYERDTSVPNTPFEEHYNGVDPEQLINRVNDFLCAERVSQMTKTYNDIEAVTRLLEEKERDLELAARIGQTLLSKNKELVTRTESLEEQLTISNDKVNQLHHDISKKEDLLRFYNDNLEHDNSDDTTTDDRSGPVVSMDFLEKKVKTLEDENINLRIESAKLKSDTDILEEKEKEYVQHFIQQLAKVNFEMEALTEALNQTAEENALHKEEITSLLAQVADLQRKIRILSQENEKNQEEIMASSESKRKLTKELKHLKDRNDELYEMLKEAQDELKMFRGKNKVCSSGQHHHSAYSVPTDSLASELESSMQQEFSPARRRSRKWKVFETAKAAKKAVAKAAQKDPLVDSRMSYLESDSQGPSAYPSDVESLPSDGYNADMDSLYGSNPELGQPGIPGSNDLESALKRLAMRRANERDFQDEEDERRRSIQAAISSGTSPYSGRSPVPWGLRSPAGSLSSSNWSLGGNTNHHFKLSDKLQIVKPMEGSMTLRHWQHLATPNLSGIFEEREGVQIRGEKKVDPIDGIYSLSDYEEDDDLSYVHRINQDMSLSYAYKDSLNNSSQSHMSSVSFLGTSTPVSANVHKEERVSGTNLESQHIHSTQQNTQTDNSSPSSKKSLGLASLFQGRENTEVGRALMRVSALKIASSSNETSSSHTANSDYHHMALSARSFGSSVSTSRNIPGSRSFDQAMQEYEDKRKTSDSAKKPELFAPGMTGRGFLQQLKSKGYSLYGLWGGSAKDNQSDGVESSTDAVKDGDKVTNQSAFSNGADVGVLGALTNFRRNGMF